MGSDWLNCFVHVFKTNHTNQIKSALFPSDFWGKNLFKLHKSHNNGIMGHNNKWVLCLLCEKLKQILTKHLTMHERIIIDYFWQDIDVFCVRPTPEIESCAPRLICWPKMHAACIWCRQYAAKFRLNFLKNTLHWVGYCVTIWVPRLYMDILDIKTQTKRPQITARVSLSLFHFAYTAKDMRKRSHTVKCK